MKLFTRQLPIFLLVLTPLLFLFTTDVAFAESSKHGYMADALWSFVFGFFGWMMGVGGSLLDFGVTKFVIEFGSDFSTPGGIGVTVSALWSTVRDFFNIFFIFGLVYIGFKMILNSDDSGSRRWLIHLILAALLINFSLYITQIFVDFTNMLATQIAQGFTINGGATVNVSNTFVNSLGLTNSADLPEELGSPFTYIFGTMILFLVSAFVFGAGGMLLIIRYCVLIFYMILSPLMFLGWVFPGLQSVTSQYWKGFMAQAFFAPLYILLLYFSASLISTYFTILRTTNGNTMKIADSLGSASTASFANTIPPFILACVFLIASLTIAKKMGVQGASQAVSAGKRYRKGIQNSTMWIGKKATSPVTKRVSNTIGNSLNTTVDRWQKGQAFGGGKIAKYTGLSGAAKITASIVAVDSAAKSGAAKLKAFKGGAANTADEDKAKKGVIKARVQADRDIKAGHKAQDALEAGKKVPGSISNEEKTQLEQLVAKGQQTANKLSPKELEMMAINDKDMFGKVIGNVNTKTFDKMMDNDNLSTKQKEDMLEARQDAIGKTIKENEVILTENLQNMSVKQIETMGDQFIRDNAHLFSQSQMDGILKSDEFVEGQKGAYIGARKENQKAVILGQHKRDHQESLFKHNTEEDPSTYSKDKKPVEVANLSFEVLASDYAVQNHIDSSVLEEIYNKKTLNNEERDVLRDKILASGTKSAKDYLTKTVHGRRNWNMPESGSNSGTVKTAPAGVEVSQGGIQLDTNVGRASKEQDNR